VDCRTPPGMDADGARERATAVLGDGDYELEFVDRAVGGRSSPDTPLFEAIAAWVARVDPGARVIPTVMAGFSDSHWFRNAFGAVSYGFCPKAGCALPELRPPFPGAT